MKLIIRFCVFTLVGSILQTKGLPVDDGWNWEDDYDVPSPTSSSTTRTSTIFTTTISPTTTTIRTSTPNHDYVKCIKDCPTTNEYNPVCGTDNVSYDNENKMRCARWCGIKVEKSYQGNCGRPPITTSTTSISPNPTPTLSPDYRSCIKRCPSTPEYNPVCGTDNVTYGNENKMRCAQQCGASVEKLFDGNCGGRSPLNTSTTTPSSNIPLPRNYLSCVRRCTVSEENNPVCGTDGVTYYNEDEIKCDIKCGRNVRKLHEGDC